VTVDCGITAAAEVEEIVKKGVDVIITDHHEPTDKIPHCVATLNPKLLHSEYPNRDLTGVGVAFKLAHGMTNHLVGSGKLDAKQVDLKSYLDLVALGTISDMGALLGENRIMVRYGLAALQRTQRIGLAKLISVCEIDAANLNTMDIASKIAPRLNSLGRIADPRKGVLLLLVQDEQHAEELAKELDLNNIERQKIERTMSLDVERRIKTDTSELAHKAIVMASDRWHPGVIPIVATRMAKLYNRPTLMIAIESGIGKGSIRSIPEFPLLPILKESSDLLLNFGGHDFAAGLTIEAEKIDVFKDRFLAAANTALEEGDIMSKLPLDSEVRFSDLTFDFMDSMQLLEPYGNENPPPVLYCEATQAWPPKVVGKTHLKMFLEQEDRMLEGIAFGMAAEKQRLRKKGSRLRIAFTPQINVFQNKSSIQLLIRGFQVLDENSEGAA
jgi:single-stranded-DNA-specific exonuclease